MLDKPALRLVALLMVVLAGLFAGAETGIYRLSRLRLRLGAERGRWSAVLLARVMRDSPGLLLSLLVGTNLSHYVATSFMTSLFLGLALSEQAAELYAMLALAPLLFVFSELIPKNIFLQRADVLTWLVAPLLYLSHKVFTWCGIVPLLRLLAGLFAGALGSPVPTPSAIASSQSHQVKALLRDTQEEGLLSPVQTEIIDRLVNIPGVRLGTVMVPLLQVRTVPLRCNRATLLEELGRHALTRLPVWQDTPGNIVGFIDVYEALGSGEEFESVEKFLHPIRSLDVDTPIIDAIDIMRREQARIILVMRRRGGRAAAAGTVTMKDLVEELMGELAEW
jgi:putative hemolysin